MTILVIKYIAANIYCQFMLQNPMPIKKGIIKKPKCKCSVPDTVRTHSNIKSSTVLPPRPVYHQSVYHLKTGVFKLTSIFPISLPSLLATSLALANNKSKSS